MSEVFDAARLCIGLFFLIIASVQDIKRRRVSDIIWLVLGLISIILLVAQLLIDDARWEYFLLLVPAAVFFFDVFWDREPLYYEGRFNFVPAPIFLFAISFVLMAWLFSMFSADTYFLKLFTVPVMLLVCYGLYYSRLLRGGADAKALMCIAMLVPFYPTLSGLPLISIDPRVLDITSIFFPFALVVLMNATILFIFSPLVFLIYNAKRGDVRFPYCLVGYRVGIDRVPRFSWLMDRVEGGEVRTSSFPRKSVRKKAELRRLSALGRKRVWVTPQLPFIVPMTAGFLLSFTLGNIFFGIAGLFLPR